MKQREEMDKSIIIIRDFNIPFSVIIKTNKQKNKHTGEMKNTHYQLDISDIHG